MAVRIRMKKMGKKARPFYRIVVVDVRTPRDGKVIEEVGQYDPMIGDTDARVILKRERVDYWLGVGAQPSEKTAVLIKKYGTSGTHLSQQETAQAALQASRKRRSSKPAQT
ncbi:MAG: 30S ribosomal protein S16 [Pirellulaceae bacterium]|nr:30S ribosomal protein S16 [Pirellulaceae bacterium]